MAHELQGASKPVDMGGNSAVVQRPAAIYVHIEGTYYFKWEIDGDWTRFDIALPGECNLRPVAVASDGNGTEIASNAVSFLYNGTPRDRRP